MAEGINVHSCCVLPWFVFWWGLRAVPLQLCCSGQDHGKHRKKKNKGRKREAWWDERQRRTAEWKHNSSWTETEWCSEEEDDAAPWRREVDTPGPVIEELAPELCDLVSEEVLAIQWALAGSADSAVSAGPLCVTASV